jgi:hypothetical protein
VLWHTYWKQLQLMIKYYPTVFAIFSFYKTAAKTILLFIGLVLLSFKLYAQAEFYDKFALKEEKYWNIEELDAARNSGILSELEADVLFEINKARSNPSKYAELYLKPMLKDFDGKLYKNHWMTREGAKAVLECINVLEHTKKLPPIQVDKKLTELAKYHTERQGKKGGTGHTSPNGKTFQKRLKDFVKKGYATGEVISYGENQARDIVIQLLVDDGVSSRGHRRILLDRKFTHAGAAFGEHVEYEFMCTVDFYAFSKKKR